MGLKKEFIEEIFKAIAMIHFEEPKDLIKEPEEDDGHASSSDEELFKTHAGDMDLVDDTLKRDRSR